VSKVFLYFNVKFFILFISLSTFGQNLTPLRNYTFDQVAKKAKRKILTQINRANHRSKLIQDTYEYIKSIEVLSTNTLLGHRQIFVSSMGEGRTVVEKQRKGKAIDEIKGIANKIISELN
jgi:hypothetical protein